MPVDHCRCTTTRATCTGHATRGRRTTGCWWTRPAPRTGTSPHSVMTAAFRSCALHCVCCGSPFASPASILRAAVWYCCHLCSALGARRSLQRWPEQRVSRKPPRVAIPCTPGCFRERKQVHQVVIRRPTARAPAHGHVSDFLCPLHAGTCCRTPQASTGGPSPRQNGPWRGASG